MIDKRTASFMRSLAMGQIEEGILFPYPEPRRGERETLGTFLRTIRSMLGPREADFAAWDRAGELPAAVLQELRDAGLFGLVVPEHLGGLGLSATGYARVLQELGRHDASVAVTVGAHSSIGMRGLLLFGTEDQKARYLPRLATGALVAAFCLSEPGAGSDAASLRATAVRDGDHWVLDGEKIWVSNGGIASFFTVFARTGGEGRGQITAFIVTRDLPGVSTGPRQDKMGIRASSTASVILQGVRVSEADVLGEVGKGFKVAMKILNAGRTGLGGGAVGGMKRLIQLAVHHALERVQFGKPIAEFGLVREKLAQMVVDCYAAESVVNLVAGLTDRGYDDTAVEAAISKVLATEGLWRTADEALQIAGGAGYMRELPYERALRDARVNRIFEGTNDILRLFIAFTAAGDVAEELHGVAESVRGVFADPVKGFGVLSDYALRRASLAANVRREKGRWTAVHPVLAAEAALFEEGARGLALALDRALRRHGRRMVEEQPAARRLADAMIDLFALAAMLARVSGRIDDHGEAAATPEREVLRAFAGAASRRVRVGLAGLEDNDDAALQAVAGHLLDAGGYEWDNY